MKISEAAALWEPLPVGEWNDEAARHLLRRTGWAARPDAVERAVKEGLPGTLDRLFPSAPVSFPKTPLLLKLEEDYPELRQKARQSTGLARRAAQRDLRERANAAIQEFRLEWLQVAATPENAAFAKWVLFLSDVYVVSAEKVRHAGFIWTHFDTLGRHAFDAAPKLTKAVSRSPAMAMYLDLAQSNKTAPNENFARELFELFVLGEGHYSEQDIKEAARAFTGYRVDPFTGEFRFEPRRHDARVKTLWGAKGAFSGDEVIDLAYQQPAAAVFLPRELARFYLTGEALSPDIFAGLADRWREQGYSLKALTRDFFGSRMFFAPEYRGNFIKSPIHFYLGLLQDLSLSVPPLPRFTSNRLRQMGQQLFQPPNVRGWIGGRAWINSSTLAARRQVVQQLFAPIREEALNADERAALDKARQSGVRNFTVSDDWLEGFAAKPVDEATASMITRFLPGETDPELERALQKFVEGRHEPAHRAARFGTALRALLQTPAYQLC